MTYADAMDSAKFVYHYLYQWQTLLTGIMALAGALVTVRYIRLQINQAEDLAKVNVTREEAAARAVLSLNLND